MSSNAILLSDLIQRGKFAHVPPADEQAFSSSAYASARVDARGNVDFGMSPLAYSSLLLSQRLAELADAPDRNRTEILKAIESFVSDLERLR
jgi:hypothetical protein